MYLGWLHKKAPEKCSINVLKKSFLDRFRLLDFFPTTRNDRIFLSCRVLKKDHMSMNSCILVGYTRKHPKIRVSMSSKKVFWIGFGFSNFFRLLETAEIFFLLGLLKSIPSAWTYVFWLVTHESTRKLQYQYPQKKFFKSVSASRFFPDYSKWPNFS